MRYIFPILIICFLVVISFIVYQPTFLDKKDDKNIDNLDLAIIPSEPRRGWVEFKFSITVDSLEVYHHNPEPIYFFTLKNEYRYLFNKTGIYSLVIYREKKVFGGYYFFVQ